MKRLIFGLFILLAFTSTAAAEDLFFPLKVGHSWTYKASNVLAGVSLTTRVEAQCQKTKDIDGKTYHQVLWSDATGGYKSSVWLRSTAEGVEVLGASDYNFPLLPWLGNEQSASLKINGHDIKLSVKSGAKKETLKVPAGSYECVSVSAKVSPGKAVHVSLKVWYAKGVGAVKVVQSVTTGQVEVKRVFELEAFQKATAKASKKTPERAKTGAGTKSKNSGLKALIAKAVGEGQLNNTGAALKSRLKALRAAAKALSSKSPGPEADGLSTQVATSLTWTQKLADQLLVCSGDANAGIIKDSIVFVDGDLAVTSYLKDSVLICTGDIAVAGYVKDCLIVCLGDLAVSGYTKDSVIEVEDAVVSGYAKGCLFVNTNSAPTGKNVQHKAHSPRLWTHVK